MEYNLLIFRGRQFSGEEIRLIRDIVEKGAAKSRRSLGGEICEKLDWRSPNGNLKVIPCLEALRRMEKAGLVSLPAAKNCSGYREMRLLTPEEVNFKEPENVSGTIKKGENLRFKLVENAKENLLWRYLIQEYHYLGYCRLVGRHIKYFVYGGDNLVSVLSFSDGIYHHRLRDNYLGWDEKRKKENRHFVINNNRFLILPWVKLRNLGSRILGQSAKTVPFDWEKRYGYRPKFMETFVEVDRFPGTVYKAANWTFLGETIGKGRRGQNYFLHGSKKYYFLYMLR
jgi:hypothetical protein